MLRGCRSCYAVAYKISIRVNVAVLGNHSEVFITSDQRCGGTAFSVVAAVPLLDRCVDDPWSENWLSKDESGLPCST